MRIDLESFLRNERNLSIPNSGSKFGLRDRANDHARPNYRESGHSSVNTAATTFGKSTPDVRDIADQADQTVPSNLEFAPSYDGAGDKAQEDGNIPTTEDKGGVGPLQGQDWENYKQVLGHEESRNNYSSINSIGYIGRWQMGAPALEDLGYVKKGTSTRSLKNPSVWTGKNGINSREDFLGNEKIQNDAMLKYTRSNYKTLLRIKVISTSTPKDQVAGLLAAAHLKGCGGARDFKNGRDNRDAYGTSTSKYYNLFAKSDGLNDTSHTTAARSTGVSPDQKTVSSSVVPDAASFSLPSSPAAPKYPYNKVTEYEGGHFKEYDSTPGFERIQERHKTGTGYEVMPDGSERVIVVGSRYTAIMGNDHIMINGQCQVIVNGDCGLRVNGSLNHSVSNDYNLHVGGNFALTVKGNYYQSVDGGKATNVSGDMATSVEGFSAVGVGGDHILTAASINNLALDGNFNVGATKDVNVATMANTTLNATGNVSLASKGDFASSSTGKMSVLGEGDTMIASTGGKATLHGSGETVVHSGGSVKLDGSEINATPYVDRAEWANRGGVVQLAAALGGSPGVPPTPQGSSGGGSSASDRKENVKNTDSEKIDKAFEKFEAFDASKTQGHAGGQGELHGYSGGFPYEA